MESILNEGFKVMFIGMATVFVFLIIMVVVIYLSSKVVQIFQKSEQLQDVSSVNKSHIAAITAAVTAFIKLNKKK